MQLYNFDSNGLPLEYPLGGLPLFSNDLNILDTNTKLFGTWSIIKDFDVILSGCKIHNINTDTLTCSITDGYIFINGKVLALTGQTNISYPFYIVENPIVVDDVRLFKSGDVHSVSKQYTSQIIFTTPALASPFIKFNPFTHQKVEYLLNNLSKPLNGLELLSHSFNPQVLKDELGNNITGSISLNCFDGVNGKWKYLGYTQSVGENSYLRKQSVFTNTNQYGGNYNDYYLNSNQLPDHTHSSGDYVTDSNTETYYGRNGSSIGGTDLSSGVYGPTITYTHQHDIQGNSGNNNRSLSLQPITYLPYYQNVKIITWGGYPSSEQFWRDNTYYLPNM